MTPILGLYWGYHHVKALGIPDQMDMPEFNLYKLVWEKNGVNFWYYVSVNLDFLGLVGVETSDQVSNALSYQEGSLNKFLDHKSNWSLNYLGFTISGKIDILAPLKPQFSTRLATL